MFLLLKCGETLVNCKKFWYLGLLRKFRWGTCELHVEWDAEPTTDTKVVYLHLYYKQNSSKNWIQKSPRRYTIKLKWVDFFPLFQLLHAYERFDFEPMSSGRWVMKFGICVIFWLAAKTNLNIMQVPAVSVSSIVCSIVEST